jgi:hypothetical protein
MTSGTVTAFAKVTGNWRLSAPRARGITVNRKTR